MRHFTFLIFALILMVSCKKEIRNNNDSSRYLKNVQAALKDSLSTSDYTTLDFSKAILSKVDSVSLYLLRIPMKGKSIKNDFVLVKTDVRGEIQRGKIVHLEGTEKEFGSGGAKSFFGNITISSLSRTSQLNSAIDNGYIIALHPQMNMRTSLADPIYPDPYITLPEVVIVAYIHTDSGISFSDWIWLESFFYDYGGGGGGSSGGYYGSMDVTGGGYYDGGGGGGGYYGSDGDSGDNGGYGVVQDPPILVDYESQYSNPAIDLDKYIKCFTNIPDAGATCSIEIFTDIPVDSDPSKFFDWSNGSPGHTFLQIKKSNSGQYAMQNIGFYPVSGWKTTLTTAPIDGKFVDNSGHEMNASLKMNITPEQLSSALTHMQYLARFVKYDIDEYNCTDWAMEVFNYIRSPLNELKIPKYDLPGAAAPYGTSTPNGLYIKLQEIKNGGGPEAANVDIGFIKGYVASSDGPCN